MHFNCICSTSTSPCYPTLCWALAWPAKVEAVPQVQVWNCDPSLYVVLAFAQSWEDSNEIQTPCMSLSPNVIFIFVCRCCLFCVVLGGHMEFPASQVSKAGCFFPKLYWWCTISKRCMKPHKPDLNNPEHIRGTLKYVFIPAMCCHSLCCRYLIIYCSFHFKKVNCGMWLP